MRNEYEEALEYWQFRYEYAKAKKYYDKHLGEYEYREHNKYIESLKIAIEAIEKQTPKKLKHKTETFVIQGYEYEDDCIFCPFCDRPLGNLSVNYNNEIEKHKHCPDCGQALDWSDENE